MNGVKNINDPLWNTYFKSTFNGPYLSKIPFYSILGNHDYGYNAKGNVTAQLLYNIIDKRWNMPYFWYTKTFLGNNFTVQLVFIDTQILAPTAFTIYGHPELASFTSAHLTWLKNTLQSSTADWLFVVGHYPLFTNQGDSKSLISSIKKIMVDNKVDGYICGHIHNLQILQYRNENVRYYLSGAGMQAATDNPAYKSSAHQIFLNYRKQGFMKHMVNKTTMVVSVHYHDGSTPYTYVQKSFRKN